jgi:predicted RND superfamily exporter protein
MTVETTTFLTTGKMVNGHEKSAKFLKSHKNLIIFLLAFVLLLFCISASVLQVHSEIKKNEKINKKVSGSH